MQRLHALLLVLVLWAVIYLPGLGSTELKGEEGRRILPAITMLETGRFLVPYIGGEPYLRKPPLLNWAIAGPMALTGLRNEWVARLPSVLSVLAVAVALIVVAGRPGWIGVPTALVAAILFLTQAATVEKGRLAEIEALYFGLSGVAMVLWLAWWGQERSSWLLWLIPSVLLGLGLLTKGPAHLLYFYAVVLCVLAYGRELRRLWHPAHLLGLLVAAGIFLAWCLPYLKTEAGRYAVQVWKSQSVGRAGGTIDWAGWATNLPRGLSNHLPWLLLAPLLWRRDLAGLGARELALFRGTRLAVVVTFVGTLLIPGMLPRYTLPLLAPFSLLLAYAVGDERLPARTTALRMWWRGNGALAGLLALVAFASPALYAIGRQWVHAHPAGFTGRYTDQFEPVLAAAAGALLLSLFVLLGRRKLARPALLATGSGILVGAATLLYAAIGIPWVNARDHVRPTALRIDTALPIRSEELFVRGDSAAAPAKLPPRLFVYDPEYQPALFYLKTPFQYAPDLSDIPAEGAWVLTRAEKLGKLQHERPDLEVAERLGKPSDLLLLKPHGEPAVRALRSRLPTLEEAFAPQPSSSLPVVVDPTPEDAPHENPPTATPPSAPLPSAAPPSASPPR